MGYTVPCNVQDYIRLYQIQKGDHICMVSPFFAIWFLL